MAVSVLGIKTVMDRVSGVFSIQDITDYLGQGVDVNTDTVGGFLKVEYNIGAGWVVVYNNLAGITPDIAPPGSYYNTVSIPLVLSGGKPLPAQYRVTYSVNIDNGASDYDVEQAFSYQYTFTDPTVCLTGSVDCGASTLTGVDTTIYEVAGTTITSLVRAHTWYAPPTSGLSDLGPANLKTLVYTGIATMTWTQEERTTVTYLQDDGLYITVLLTGTLETNVQCATTLGTVLCCINQVNATYESYVCSSTIKAENYRKLVLEPTLRYMLLYLGATAGGNATKAAAAYATMLEVSGCTGCGCQDVSQVVPPANSGGNNQIYVVDSPDNSIDVVTETIGGTTTFHIQVSSAIMTIINNLGNAFSVVSGSPEITVTPSGSNPKVFTITYTGPSLPVMNFVRKRLILVPGDGLIGSNFIDISANQDIGTNGPDVSLFGTHVVTLGTTTPNQSTDIALLTVSNFLAGAAKDYIADAFIMRVSDTVNGVPTDLKDIDIECFWYAPANTTGYTIFRFFSPVTGQPYTLQQLYDLFADVSTNPAGGAVHLGINFEIAP